MEITSAEFVVSNSRADMCPKTHLPEYAFIGRSNVGKQSEPASGRCEARWQRIPILKSTRIRLR